MGDFNYVKGVPFRIYNSTISIDYRNTKYMHFLNGQMIDGHERDKILRKLKNEDIESVKLMPAEQAVELYGQKAANGVIFVVTHEK